MTMCDDAHNIARLRDDSNPPQSTLMNSLCIYYHCHLHLLVTPHTVQVIKRKKKLNIMSIRQFLNPRLGATSSICASSSSSSSQCFFSSRASSNSRRQQRGRRWSAPAPPSHPPLQNTLRKFYLKVYIYVSSFAC